MKLEDWERVLPDRGSYWLTRFVILRLLGVIYAIAFLVAFVHPVLVDQPHANHHREDPAGSPVPQYLPPACAWIDWLTAALLLGALFLL